MIDHSGVTVSERGIRCQNYTNRLLEHQHSHRKMDHVPSNVATGAGSGTAVTGR